MRMRLSCNKLEVSSKVVVILGLLVRGILHVVVAQNGSLEMVFCVN
jgi:hypothetical protein